jgi:hypothetical protein
MTRKFNVFLFLFSAVFFTGCDQSTQPNEYSNQLVVSAFLTAEQPIDSVFVTRTGNLLEYYSPQNSAITNAIVKITLVDTINPTANVTYTLAHDNNHPGRYYSSSVVMPLRIYLLSVEAPGYPLITGKTTVPDTFSIVNRIDFPDTVAYDPVMPSYTLNWTSSRNYSDYVGSVASIDLSADDIPSDFRSADDPKPDKTSVFNFNSPNINSASIIWLAVNYYGRNLVTIEAVDYNYYDYLRQYVVSGGTELRQIRYNISGGLGVFGSSARAHNSFTIFIKP